MMNRTFAPMDLMMNHYLPSISIQIENEWNNFLCMMTNSLLTRIKWTAFMQKYANNLFPVVTIFYIIYFCRWIICLYMCITKMASSWKTEYKVLFPDRLYLDVEKKKISKKRLHGVFRILKDILFFIIK